jgi:crotonobetainyl-CoA:carnitine CoA-transferase CaiB-like acyl-CoA transferase
VALLAALEHRRRTGEGQLIEIAQIEVAACLAAEPVIEYSMNGVVTPRDGNRQRGYLQGVYPTAVDGAWVAISVPDGIGLDHDAFDEAVAAWTSTLAPSDVIKHLDAQGVPAEQVLTAEAMYDVAVLDARNYYQELEHPINGAHRYPGWPFRITPGQPSHHRFPPPTLGQHNREVLRGLGLTDAEIDDLRARKVIGERALNA